MRVHSPTRCVSEMMSCPRLFLCCFMTVWLVTDSIFNFCYLLQSEFQTGFFFRGRGGGNVNTCQDCMRASVYPLGFVDFNGKEQEQL